MIIRIGAFGSKETIENLQTYEETWENIRIIPFTYDTPAETVELVRHAYGCDVYLFTGPIPYMYARDALGEVEVPHVVVAFDQLMISNGFNVLQRKNQGSIERLSIDIMDKESVLEILDVLEIGPETIHIFDYYDHEPFSIDEIVQFHVDLWESDDTYMALTSIVAVEEVLTRRGVPCIKMPIPQKNVELALQEAQTLGQLYVSQTSKIVVGFLKVKDREKYTEALDDFQMEKRSLSLHQILLRCTHEMDLSLYKGSNQFVIFGTKGSLDNLVSGNHLKSYIREIEQTLGVEIVIGFGSGNTAARAEDHAKIAMVRALQDDGSSCYLYDDAGRYAYLLSETEAHFKKETLTNELMKEGSITLDSASTFVEFLIARNFNAFTTQEYASYSKVTTRTAARLIRKLLTSGMLGLAGEKKLYEKGRPRTMYELKEIDRWDIK